MSDQIKQLSEKDKVRRKISVWLGSSNHNAVIHCIRELVGNSADEILKGNGGNIKITLHNNKTVTVEDDCQGLPLEGTNENGKDNWELLFLTLFAGSKYENGIENNNYSVGSNGLFISVLTFSSQKVNYEIARPDGNIYSIGFEKGELTDELKIIGKSDKTYTKITYTLDDEVYEGNYYEFEELCNIASEQASLINGSITVVDEQENKINTYTYENGIRDYLENNSSEGIHDQITFNKDISFEVKRDEIEEVKIDDIKMDVVFKYTNDEEGNLQVEFLNGSNLIHHGTIYDGFVAGMRNAINKKIKDSNLYTKSEKQINKDDILVGLNYVVSFKSYFPVFASQTKFASYVTYYKDIMQKTIEEFLEVYFIENPIESSKIINKILVSKRSREKAETTRSSAIKQLSQEIKNSTSRPEKFVPCRYMDKNNTELIVIEGDSALNSVESSRNSKYQCIYPVKGKSLNVIKANLDSIINNKEIIDIFQILNCGMEYNGKVIKGIKKFNIDDLSVSKIIIFSDEDEDGMHIRSLLEAIFYILAPKIIENGHLYILDSPLYKITNGNNTYLAYDEKEKNEIVRSLEGKTHVQRFKGLGGLNASMLSKTAMHPENRRLTQITIDDAMKSKEMIEMFMDDEVEGRKNYIQEHGDKYFDFSIYE